MACNNDGVWNTSGASLDFIIAPAFYQALWFRVLAWMTSGLALLGLYQLRIAHLARQMSLRAEERLAERTRIAQELHDTLLQNIAGFALQLGGLAKTVTEPSSARERLTEMRQTAEKWLHEARESVWDLRSPIAERQDLAELMLRTGERITSRGSMAFSVTVAGAPCALDPRVQDNLLRIFQEAARNAVYHSDAESLEVRLEFLPSGRISLHIRDDGRGFDPAEVSRVNGHFGLMTIRERAKGIGADLHIDAAPGNGVHLSLTARCILPKNKERD
jgi:signal transduction histidine kinase